MRKISKLIAAVTSIIIIASNAPKAWADVQVAQQTPLLLISELQTEGLTSTDSARSEFIELYNPGSDALDVNGWQLQYLSANHKGAGAPTRVIATITGTIEPHGFVLIAPRTYLPVPDIALNTLASASGYMARSGGHLRLMTNTGLLVDGLAWGTATALAGESKVADIPAGTSVQRLLQNLPTNGGTTYALPSTQITPQGGGFTVVDDEEELPCKEIVFSEVLPNPDGADKGHEFIELYNPTAAPISLQGCVLRLSEGSQEYALPPEELLPGAYRSFFDSETGITLPNATAQPLFLIAGHQEQQLDYPSNVPDNVAWAFSDGLWRITYAITPGAVNVISLPTVMHTEDNTTDDSAADPCPEGKERNSATNRCRTVIQPASATPPCASNQERNLETGRCRAVVATDVEPCREGQERNPATNRCRTVLSATSLATCPEGQERYAETNRCRKIVPSTTGITVHDVPAATSAGYGKLALTGTVVLIILGYGVYEWRHDITNWCRRHSSRMGKP